MAKTYLCKHCKDIIVLKITNLNRIPLNVDVCVCIRLVVMCDAFFHICFAYYIKILGY